MFSPPFRTHPPHLEHCNICDASWVLEMSPASRNWATWPQRKGTGGAGSTQLTVLQRLESARGQKSKREVASWGWMLTTTVLL